MMEECRWVRTWKVGGCGRGWVEASSVDALFAEASSILGSEGGALSGDELADGVHGWLQ
jgi:hypothetical protein